MECFAPLDTIICEGSYSSPLSLLNFSAIALRRGSSPEDGVYLVCPASSASFAAAMMFAGVLKSGSPAPKEMTGSPAAFIAFALAVTASVREGEMAAILDAILLFIYLSPVNKKVFPYRSPVPDAARAFGAARNPGFLSLYTFFAKKSTSRGPPRKVRPDFFRQRAP